MTRSSIPTSKWKKAVEDGSITRFNMQEGPADGDQDLNLWAREFEDHDVVRDIMEDPIFKGNQNARSRWTWARLVSGFLVARQMPAWHSKLDN